MVTPSKVLLGHNIKSQVKNILWICVGIVMGAMVGTRMILSMKKAYTTYLRREMNSVSTARTNVTHDYESDDIHSNDVGSQNYDSDHGHSGDGEIDVSPVHSGAEVRTYV